MVLYREGETIRSVTITGAKERLAALTDLPKVAQFDAKKNALARHQQAELLGRVAA